MGMPKDNAKRRKDDPELIDLLKRCAILDEKTGNIRFEGCYVSAHLDICWKGTVISVPHSHVVWLLKQGRWPLHGNHIDHRDDDAMNNAPDNLEELTQAENQRKRRNRIISRAYGKGKYGYGIQLYHDKRDGRYYITRSLSRGHHTEEGKTIRRGLGGFETRKEALDHIKKITGDIEKYGETYVPESTKNEKHSTRRLNDNLSIMRKLRAEGWTIQQIADELGFSPIAVYNRVKDMGIDKRRTT